MDFRIRPYSVECTRSRSISEVKQPQAGLVLGWVTAWEYPVSYPFILVPLILYFSSEILWTIAYSMQKELYKNIQPFSCNDFLNEKKGAVPPRPLGRSGMLSKI